jgi:hypothetical protein
VKVRLDEVEDFDLPHKDKVFTQAFRKFRQMFPDRRVPRVGMINDITFECGSSVTGTDILSDALSKDRWKEGLREVRITLKNPREGNNVNVELIPVTAQQVRRDSSGTQAQNIGFAIHVKVDVNNQDMSGDLRETDVRGIIGFAEDYVSDQLYKFLNNEPGI